MSRLRKASNGKQQSKVNIRTHKGSGERTITVGLLRQVAHLPQQEAADRLNVGNTRFKTATRELGMQAWPYRKIKSIRNLLAVVKEDPDLFCDGDGENCAASMIEYLEAYEEMVFREPLKPLSDAFKKFRQAAYKEKHKRNATREESTSHSTSP